MLRWNYRSLGAMAFAGLPNEEMKYLMLSGARPEWLIRWNSLPDTVVVGHLEGPAMEVAGRILWVRKPTTCVADEIPITEGGATILFSQLDVQWHVNRSGPAYDPVAERILVNMLKQAEDY
ncbi:MAG: hypothetical protein OEW48_21320 [Phycisphaerae bacterium]|nr:hypothetical protein [Phycisphaerae bacterium]